MIIWFTGLSGAGKSTLCQAAERELRSQGHRVEVLDGDEVRQNLSKDLGFSKQDRIENLMRIHYVSQLLARNGVVVLVAAISPYRETREEIRRTARSEFLEVYVKAPLQVCEQRDPKGLYRRARQGLIPAFTGISDPYEPPVNPDVVCYTDTEDVDESCAKVLARVNDLLRKSSSRAENDGTKAIRLPNSRAVAK
jgi:adenylylsulfate kinase